MIQTTRPLMLQTADGGYVNANSVRTAYAKTRMDDYTGKSYTGYLATIDETTYATWGGDLRKNEPATVELTSDSYQKLVGNNLDITG